MLEELIKIEQNLNVDDLYSAKIQIISLQNKLKLLWLLTSEIDTPDNKSKYKTKENLEDDILFLKNSLYNLKNFSNYDFIDFNFQLLNELYIRIKNDQIA
ncbi:hypothetical protein [uncultured Cetobacterium sp.]|uniref:hypothetical protein n=1 Tax=uncultured Cetobacterium sp. TaxID=527638 RepID=UPI00262412A5|nr:hypothetical protein [uncultured Cetobacterium sp.]